MSPHAGDQIGLCQCGKPILSGFGLAIDTEGTPWHPECRAKARKRPEVAPLAPAQPRMRATSKQ